MEGRRLCKGLSFAIGIGDRRSAFGTGRKATVYAVAVRIVGDEKHSPLGIGGRDETEAKRGRQGGPRGPHGGRPTFVGGLSRQCGQIVKRSLTLQYLPSGYRFFPVFPTSSTTTLTCCVRQIIVPS